MCTEPERHMVVVGSGHVEHVRIFEHRFIAVRGAVHEKNLITCVHFTTVELVVPRDSAAHVQDGGHPSDELLDRSIGEDLRLRGQQLALRVIESEFADN